MKLWKNAATSEAAGLLVAAQWIEHTLNQPVDYATADQMLESLQLVRLHLAALADEVIPAVYASGVTWRKIGPAMGMRHQSAAERWGSPRIRD